MALFIVFLALVALIILIAGCKINPFLAFLLVCVTAGLALGIPLAEVTKSVEKGLGDILGSNVIIIVLGAMLGKLIAETGAAQQIATSIMQKVGVRNIHWALALVGFIIGIPLFYNTGFVLMIPLVFSIVFQYKLPAVATGIPLLAALSVAHGFLPPHPSPSALVTQFGANLGTTMLYGILIALPTIILAGPLFSRTLKGIPSVPLETFQPADIAVKQLPSVFNSFLAALLPVLLFALAAMLPFVLSADVQDTISFFSQPSIVMIIALAVATFTLGTRKGRSMKQVMNMYAEAVKEIAMILLIIGGAGALKQILIDSGVSKQIAELLQNISLSPLFLGWLTAAIIRVAVGSATVAGFTAAGILAPLVIQTNTDPNLMVLSIGAGSLMFSHVNDAGFWMFKEYFNLSINDTLRSWSVMETIVSVAGLIGVLFLDFIF
ncbi:MAG TPA: gluconate:H+ symporter [Flavisolibacter sp.]|nr:gluconate:H+ symporter [Flavisolibacter sp.]